MKNVFIFFINLFYFVFVIALALSISTIALTRKVNESKIFTNNLNGSVLKQKVVVVALTRGIIENINVKSGQAVKKGDVLVKMSNPILENNYKILKQNENNQSAQAQASITKVSIDNLTIKAPVDGIIGDLYTAEGSSIEEFAKVMLIYSSSDIRLQAYVTAAQYQAMQKLSLINAYSSRLNQNFVIVPGLMQADEETPKSVEEKRIGLYFTFKNNDQATALLNNEDLQINLDINDQTVKPIDVFTNFWNGLLAKNN